METACLKEIPHPYWAQEVDGVKFCLTDVLTPGAKYLVLGTDGNLRIAYWCVRIFRKNEWSGSSWCSDKEGYKTADVFDWKAGAKTQARIFELPGEKYLPATNICHNTSVAYHAAKKDGSYHYPYCDYRITDKKFLARCIGRK